MTKQELQILKKTIELAEEFFTSYCEFHNNTDEIEYQEEYEKLLDKARKIINKYKEVK